MRTVTTIAAMREVTAGYRTTGRIALVPTMGALHPGHLSLVRLASTLADVVVVSIFVNPAQFGAGEDLDAYPRDRDRDEALLAGLGPGAPDVVFAPSQQQMYPRPRLTTVHVDGVTRRLCGRSRPGHFDGVATVVTKLHTIVVPDVAVYGRKDFQQLRVIERLVADLDQPVEVVGAPIVREPDGVAMSSRNAYLGASEREAARAIPRALRGAVDMARITREKGHPLDAGMIHDAAAVILAAADHVRTDYVEVLDPDTLAPPDHAGGEGAGSPDGLAHTHAGPSPGGPQDTKRLLVAIAAHVGPARLIDNVVIGDRDDEERLIAAT